VYGLDTSLIGGIGGPGIGGIGGPTLLPSSNFQTSGVYTTFAPVLTFESKGDLQFAARAESNLRYYGEFGKIISLEHRAGADLFTKIGRNSSFRYNGEVRYAPSSLYRLFAEPTATVTGDALQTLGEAVPADVTYSQYAQRFYTFMTGGAFERKVSPRFGFTLDSDFSYTYFTEKLPDTTNLGAFRAGGRFNYQLDRRHSLLLGYHYGRANYGVGSTMLDQHSIESGVKYDRPLSKSRRMTIELTVGATNFEEGAVIVPPVATPSESTPDSQTSSLAATVPAQSTRRTSVTGLGTLGYEISRAWWLSGTYQRSLSYVDTLQNAVFSDAVTFSARGFINRRTDILASGSYASGDLISTAAIGSNYVTTGTSIRIRVALKKALAAYGEYLYYYYKFDNPNQLPAYLPPQLSRNGVQVGLTYWVPVMSRH
jgi:hypothetical protein